MELTTFVKDNLSRLWNYEEFCFARSGLPSHDKTEFVRYVDFVQYLCYSDLVGLVNESHPLAVSIGVALPFALAKDCAEAFRTLSSFKLTIGWEFLRCRRSNWHDFSWPSL
jgi:hypothetical protein